VIAMPRGTQNAKDRTPVEDKPKKRERRLDAGPAQALPPS